MGRTGCRCSFGGAFLAAAADWRGKHAAGCSADGSSGSGDGRHSPRRLSGYDGCVKFLERKTAPTGNLKRPARRSICDYYGMSVFCTVRGRSRRTCLEDFSGVCIWLRSFEIVQRSFDRVFSKCQSERNSGSVWHERREKKNGGGACCDDFCRDGALSFILRLGGTGCTGCIGTGILLL